MRLWKIGILEQDREYLEPLKAYFRAEEEAKGFVLVTFTQREAAEKHYAKFGMLDILLIGTAWWPEAASLKSFARECCLFGDDAIAGEAADTDFSMIAKYQPLPTLLSELKQQAAQGIPVAPLAGNPRGGHLLSVYSASGGSGKTMAAWNLATGLAYYGGRTLLVSLEGIPSELPFLEGCGEDRFGKLLYYVKADPGNLSSRLSGFTRIDPRSGLHYLEPPMQGDDLEGLSPAEMNALMTAFRNSGYDDVVLDLSSTLDSQVEAALTASDLILWLVADEAISLRKAQRAWAEWERRLGNGSLQERILLGVNKYTGTLNQPIELAGRMPDVFLPYMPEWKSLLTPAHLLTEPVIPDLLIAAVNRHRAGEEALSLA
ncbi:hypothetical protein [Gorillibacterium sp. CAU 1737]|uniref:AAA family ATPase n=1 Tax=Gorillibacterium sp. CAU 1737 TaxID=3140362 RepID=UPI0032605521